MMNFKRLGLMAVVFIMCVAVYAQEIVIDGFETIPGPANWVTTMNSGTSGQNRNVANGGTLTASTSYVTEGTGSGRISINWDLSGAQSGASPWPGTSPVWGCRWFNNSGSNLGNIPIGDTIKIDIYNETGLPIQFSLLVRDQSGAGDLVRGPYVTLNPGANTYQFVPQTEGVVWVTLANGIVDGTAVTINSMLFYSDDAPAAANTVFYVDNLRRTGTQVDTTPPAAPKLLFVGQGSAPGKMLIKWEANTEPDLDKYSVYMMTDADFGRTTTNRFSFPATPVKNVSAPATQTEIDVPTTGPVYIRLTAWDNATPQPNESGTGIIFGASLRPDGLAPQDLVVLDLKKYGPTDSGFPTYGYLHMIVYNAQALADNGRYFASCSPTAVENGEVTLTPGSDKIVIWSTGQDGSGTPLVKSVTPACIPSLTTYVTAGGKLFISGIGLGKDLYTNGDATQQAFFSNVLKAVVGSGNVGTNEITADGIFADAGTFYTGPDIWNLAAFATTGNESMTGNGANTAMAYTGVTDAYPCVYWGNQVVVFGFAFESVRHSTGSFTFAQAREARKKLLQTVLNYLNPVPTPTPNMVTGNWNVYE